MNFIANFLCIVLGAALSNGVAGQVSCSYGALSPAAQEQLDLYDKSLFIDPDCSDPSTPLPLHCNYMGLGQDCRGCFVTCAGALQYQNDYPEEIATYGVDAAITFCPDSGVTSCAFP